MGWEAALCLALVDELGRKDISCRGHSECGSHCALVVETHNRHIGCALLLVGVPADGDDVSTRLINVEHKVCGNVVLAAQFFDEAEEARFISLQCPGHVAF